MKIIDKRWFTHFITLLAIGLLLSACKQGRVVAPVTDGWQQDKAKETLYTVQGDDTLYSIAWAYDTDYRYLAKINHLHAPYDLEAGQKLKVYPAKGGTLASNTDVVKQAHNREYRPAAPTVNKTEVDGSNIPGSERSEKTIETTPQIMKTSINQASAEWLWPAQGDLIRRFADVGSGPKGIDIASAEGSPVYATKAGKVVYSGNGLRGYGKLLIIKHNDEFLSAYAHNQELFVQEGQTVSQGQHIAAMGKTGAGSVKLHFEIRRAGKPVDPLQYLQMQA